MTGADPSSPEARPPWANPRSTLIAWMCSILIHSAICFAAVIAYQRMPEGTAPQETNRTAGVALVRKINGLAEYFTESGPLSDSARLPSNDTTPSPEAFLPSEDELAIDDVFGALPTPNGTARAGEPSLPGRAGDVTANSGGPRGKVGTARTKVFGLEGEGNRFVYVFDRSGSMDGFDARPLRAAKAELLNSLIDLQRIHQFQIIFYNERPKVFNPGGGRARMMWGDEASKRLARAFVNSVSASGSTDHMAALRKALALSPDVIFFLTDADEPRLTTDELQTVSRLNHGCTIHAIEFGLGPQRTRRNFLTKLAAENFGQHIYVNIRDL